ncbi:MAG TPA: lysine--tRNA ligase [Chloroflexota bacterium]|jgi:lysyl-tRNA synthetase class 2|nr:lysine--tRNA ligase [Chloroflexota bacterium]
MAENGSDGADRIVQARLDKLARLEDAGLRGFPTTFERTHKAAEVQADFNRLEGQRVCVAGRLDVFRKLSGNLVFVGVKDDSGRIQLMLHPRDLDATQRTIYDALDPGDFVGACGNVIKTRSGEVTVEVSELTFLGKSLRNPPEKWHGLVDVETRYRQRYLDLMANPDTRQVFLTRSRLISAIRRFLDAQGFVEVETPILQPIPGGGSARPFATESNAMDSEMYLRIALELYLKRCIIGGIERVYEIGRNFRNEGVSFKHSPEFTMLELYQAYADYQDIMRLTENLVSTAAKAAVGRTKVTWGDQEIDFAPPWQRMPLRTAIAEYSGVDYADYPELAELRGAAARAGLRPEADWNYGKILDELLTAFVEPKLIQPTFLTDYPTSFPGSTLAKGKPDNPAEVERFEAFAGGIEIANAFSELNDPRVQRERFLQQVRAKEEGDAEAQPFDQDFLTALEHGMPPTGGMGLGIDRIAMLLTDQHTIRDVILFPQLRRRDDHAQS